MSISKKVTLIIMAIVFLNTLSIGIISFYEQRIDTMESSTEKAMAIAKSISASIDPKEFWFAINQNQKNEHYEHLQVQFNRIKE